MGKNVLIPLVLLEQIIILLEAWDTSGCNEWVRRRWGYVLGDLNEKMRRVILRDAYYKIVQADSPELKNEALSDYLEQKRSLPDSAADDDPFAAYYKYGPQGHKSVRPR